jgi:hypothetical protein
LRWRRRRKKKIARTMRTAPAAAPVATPAMVPFACCLWGLMVGSELEGAVVELGGRLEGVGEVLWGDV